MKKTFLGIFTLILSVFTLSFSACGGGGDAYYNMGANLDYIEAVPGENYRYDEVEERGFVQTTETPSSYFSLDRNTAGYAYMRSQINQNLKIAGESVRLEEYVNYFSYDYPAPQNGEELNATAYLSACPWNDAHKLMTVGIKTQEAYLEDEGGNYVFLVDVSGSMGGSIYAENAGDYTTRLELVKYALKTLVEGLSDADSVAIVTYASGISTKLDATRVTSGNRSKINKAIDGLNASGSTFGSGGIERAYYLAKKNFRQGGNNRVVLMSDGDFNVGVSNSEELKEIIQDKAKTGVYLSVIGVGMGNTRDDLMQTLALNGNGNYAYLDSRLEAKKVMSEELSGTLFTVAKDVKAGVTFNADTVASYRLLGYDMKRMSQEEFENTQKDAGEIGSNLTVTAVYEIELAESVAENAPLGEIHVKWKDVGEQNREKKLNVNNVENATNDTAFVACVAEFALVLRQSQYAGNASLVNVAARLQTLNAYVQADDYKAEFARLVNKAIESEHYEPTSSEEEN